MGKFLCFTNFGSIFLIKLTGFVYSGIELSYALINYWRIGFGFGYMIVSDVGDTR